MIKVIQANQEDQEPQKEVSITKSCSICVSSIVNEYYIFISSQQLQLIVEETGFQDHLVHQDLKDFQDHKELKVKLL